MRDDDKLWPAWFNGPKGEAAIFACAEDVPNGWTSGAEKRSAKAEKAQLDHDGDGKVGGSLKGEKATAKKGGSEKAFKPLDL